LDDLSVQYPCQAADFNAGVVGVPYNLPFSPTTISLGQSPTLVLGENGVAFAAGSSSAIIGGTNTAVSQVASFNLAGGSVNWTYQATAGYTLSIIEATAGNGLVAKTTDQSGNDSVLNFNSSGGQSQVKRRLVGSGAKQMAQPQDLSGLSNIDYYSNGWWLGSNGSAVAVVGDLIQSAMSSYSHSKGNKSKQSTAAPVIANFETVDPVFNPNQNQTAAAFQSRYNKTSISTKNAQNVSLGLLTQASFNVDATASFTNYVNQIFKPISAVSFIGHSLQGPAGAGAVGVCFGQQGIDPQTGWPLYPCYSPLSGNNYTFEYNNGVYDVTYGAPSLGGSQAKIVFWAACELSTTMQNFMGITNSTAGRALIFPASVTDIDLDMGEYEWLQILANLESGQNLKQAVANANAATAKITWYTPVNGVNTPVPAQAWQVIGDSGNGGAGIHF
jgi:hypothetical protein